MAMSRRKDRGRTPGLWIATNELPSTGGHPFYQRLNHFLDAHGFDDFVEAQCAPFYAATVGRPSVMPGTYFRLRLIGDFEGIDSERGIAWRTADSLALRGFLGLGLDQMPPEAMDHGRHDRAVGRGVTAQLVGDQPARYTSLAFQQLPKKARGGTPIAPGLHEDIDHVTVLVHSPPEILPLPLDGHKEFVQVPRVAQAASPAPQPPSVVEPERLTPLPNRFIRHGDTPFGEEIFNISETQAEAMVEPDGVTDDLGRKAVSVVAESRGRHRPTLSAARQLDNATRTSRSKPP